MRITGRVASVERQDGKGVVEVEVVGHNRLGKHVNGTVTVVMP